MVRDGRHKQRDKKERGESFRRTAQKLSTQYHVSTGAVQKYAIFSRALDTVGRADPGLPGKILSGTFKISHVRRLGILCLSCLIGELNTSSRHMADTSKAMASQCSYLI